MKLGDYLRNKEREHRNEEERWKLIRLLEKIQAAYVDDPGTADLYDEQPVNVRLTLGDVRFVREIMR